MVLHIMRGKKFSKRVLGGLLVIIIPAFVFWGVDTLTDRPKPAGKIFGRTISAENFYSSRQGVQAQIILNYFSDYASMSSILKDHSLMNRMAWERLLLLLAAKDSRVRVDNREVMLFIASHPLFQRGGGFDRSVYSSVLGNPSLSMSPRRFEELVRENLMVMKFRNGLLENISVSDEEIINKFSEYADKAVLSYFLVDKDNYFEQVEVTEEEVLAAYDRNKDRLFSKEKAAVEYIEIPYSSADEKNELAQALENLAVELARENASFEKRSGELGYKYGKTELFAQDEKLSGMSWSENFNQTAFALKDGEVSFPVFSAPDKGSAFIIKRFGTETPQLLPFDKVKTEITLALRNVKSVESAKTFADELFQGISKGELTFEEAAEKAGAAVKKTAQINSESKIDDITPAKELVSAAFSSGGEKYIPPFITHRGILLTRVDELYKAPSSELTEELRETLKKSITASKQATAVTDWLNAHSADVETYRPIEEM